MTVHEFPGRVISDPAELVQLLNQRDSQLAENAEKFKEFDKVYNAYVEALKQREASIVQYADALRARDVTVGQYVEALRGRDLQLKALHERVKRLQYWDVAAWFVLAGFGLFVFFLMTRH